MSQWLNVVGRLSSVLNDINVSSTADSEALTKIYRRWSGNSAPVSVDAYIDAVLNDVVAHASNVSSPRCLAHMSAPTPAFVRLISEIVVSLNQNLGKREASRAATLLERETLAQLHELVYRKPRSVYELQLTDLESSIGVITSGGTVSNITALWCARNRALGPRSGFSGIESEGLHSALACYGYNGCRIIVSQRHHYSMQKAADLLGLGTNAIQSVPVDADGAMRPGALDATLKACDEAGILVLAIVGTAGTTDSGSIDPLEEIAAIAEQRNIHFHVDAAWGGPLLYSNCHRDKLRGIERAHTVTLDAHKQLYMPIGCSLLLFRDTSIGNCIRKTANYMLRNGSGDLGRISLEGSRPAVSMLLHAGLRIISPEGYGWLIDKNIENTARFAAVVSEEYLNLELLQTPQTNILLYRFVPNGITASSSFADQYALNRLNETIQRIQSKRGKSLVSLTQLRDLPCYEGCPVTAMRAVLNNFKTTEDDLRAVLEDQLEIAAEILSGEGIESCR